MKNKMKTYKYMILLILSAIILNSCGDIDEERTYYKRLITFNIDGTDQYAFPYGYNGLYCNQGVIISMHDNQRFVLYNENLFIMNVVTKEVRTYLSNIDIDNDLPPRREHIGISYDDNFIAFTSGYHLYCLDLATNEYAQLTFNEKDEFPAFGIDNRIYFSRYDSEDDIYRLMCSNLDGSVIIELITTNDEITNIFPGQIDSRVIYFFTGRKKFLKYSIGDNEVYTLLELGNYPYYIGTISRTNDDHYYSFSYDISNRELYYLYDTETNTMQIYNDPGPYAIYISKVLPDSKTALMYYNERIAHFKLWDIDNNVQIGEKIIIKETDDYGLQVLAISPDGSKVAIIHGTY